MQEFTKNQLRADFNTYLNKKKQKTFPKSVDPNPRALFNHLRRIFKGKIDLPVNEILKDKEYRSILIDWINSDYDFAVMNESIRFICVNKMQRRNDRIVRQKRSTSTETFPEHVNTICNLPADKFYRSPEWRKLRYRILSGRGNICECCGATSKDGVRIHVDHIKPRSVFPELALSESNLQVLCEDCNMGKSNIHEDDWRV